MNVSLFNFNPEEQITKMWVACRTCYSAKTPQELAEEAKTVPTQEKLKLINAVLSSRHLSTCEHINFTFMISGVSRALAMQFLRHRHQSPSMQSQRYCTVKEQFDYVTPKTIQNNAELKEGFDLAMHSLYSVYNILVNAGIPAEDARYLLPNAITTNLTVTLNARELQTIAHERLCTTAQWEIRELVSNMVKLITKELPFLKGYLVPKCDMLGYCPESEKRSCGRRKTKKSIL